MPSEPSRLDDHDLVVGIPRELEVIEGEDDFYRPGSEIDFARLYHHEALRLTRTVYGILGNRAESEDCVQEAFARAYAKWGSWKPDAPARFWVQRIAINLALSRRRREHLRSVKVWLGMKSHEPSAEIGASTEVVDALRQLPVKQLTAVLLRFNHGYNNREIGDILGISERAVGLRIQSGLEQIKQILDEPVTERRNG